MKSIAIPSTCLFTGSCRSQQQASHIAHQIGRMAMHYKVDEIVIYDALDTTREAEVTDVPSDQPKKIVFGDEPLQQDEQEEGEEKKTGDEPSEDALRLAKLLQFFVTPSYLRNSCFDDLSPFQYAKKLPKLPRLPFMNHTKSRYMEGLTIPGKIAGVKKYKKGQQKSKKQMALESQTKYVTIGNAAAVELSKAVPVNARVTVDTQENKVVSPKDAYKCSYFGYAVRIANTFGKVFTECVDQGGYTYSAYVPSCEFLTNEGTKCTTASVNEQTLKDKNQQVLLVFGKWDDVNNAVKRDDQQLAEVDDASLIFDGKIDSEACSSLRVEDAVTVALAKIEGLV